MGLVWVVLTQEGRSCIMCNNNNEQYGINIEKYTDLRGSAISLAHKQEIKVPKADAVIPFGMLHSDIALFFQYKCVLVYMNYIKVDTKWKTLLTGNLKLNIDVVVRREAWFI